MTKRIVVALALVVGAAGAASAQTSISASASVAQVAQETGNDRDIVFAQGTPGGTGGSVVAATATAANATGPQLGFVEYSLNYSGPSVTVAPDATLVDPGNPANTIAVSFTCGEADAAGTGLALGACGSHNLTFAGAGLQTRRVWIGGSISQAAIDGAAATTYNGTVTLTLVP
jgi:hypothetical protein